MNRTVPAFLLVALAGPVVGQPTTRVYENKLTRITDPTPLLADHPEFVAQVTERTRYEAPALLDDADGDLHVRAWRFSYNARGIIEMSNRLKAAETAVIMVHPWGIDDGQGWKTPEPAGACDFCTPDKNALAGRHTREVINPFLKQLRGRAGLVVFSLIGEPDPIRKKLYRSVDYRPTAEERKQARAELAGKLKGFKYGASPLPDKLTVSKDLPVADYFKQFPGLDAGPKFNGPGFWQLPVPVTRDLDLDPDDVVFYDLQGYDVLRDFLRKNKIRHVLLVGYATDMCFCRTTAGYQNLSKDFNVFLVGDATLATFPANDSPRHATNAAISFASIDHLITQVSWVKLRGTK
jgi:nicotinamidase-related amidase